MILSSVIVFTIYHMFGLISWHLFYCFLTSSLKSYNEFVRTLNEILSLQIAFGTFIKICTFYHILTSIKDIFTCL